MCIIIISMHASRQVKDQYANVYRGIIVNKQVKIVVIILSLVFFIVLGLVLSKSFNHSTLNQSQARKLQFDHDYRVMRAEYRTQRKKYLKDKDSYPSLKLIESNLDITKEPDADLVATQQQDYTRLNSIHHFQQTKAELPFCLIIQSLNFTQPYLFQFTLNSIFSQNYSNYKAVIFNFDLRGHKSIEDYLQLHKIHMENHVFIANGDKKSIIENIRTASRQHCQKGSISINIVDNSELIGKNVLKVFNTVYQTNKVGMVYSNFYTYDQGFSVRLGFNSEHSRDEMNNIRKQRFALSTSVTYLTEHFLKIKEDLKDSKGNDLDLAYEQAIFFPLTQITCKRVMMIDGFHVLVKSGIKSYEEFKKSLIIKKETSMIARNGRSYSCDQSFENELKHKVLVYYRSYFTEEPALKAISDRRIQKRGINNDANSSNIFQIPEGGSHKLADYLYKDGNVLKERESYERERIRFINMVDHKDNKKLIKANLKLGEYSDNFQQKQEEQQLTSASQTHKINQYSEELPFCIIVEELEYQQQVFRFQNVLNSIFNQHYSNLFTIIINNNIRMDQYIRKYLAFYKINRSHYVYLQNYEDKSMIEMLYNVLVQHCSKDSMAIVLDGSGEMLGKNTIKVFNRYFLQYKAGFVYSNYYLYKQSRAELSNGKTEYYSQEEKSKNKYRSNQKYGQLMAFRTELFLQIDVKDFHDDQGKFIYGSFGNHIYSSILELSCKNIHKIKGVHYVEHQDIVEQKRFRDKSRFIDAKKNYGCSKEMKQADKPATNPK